MIHGGYNISATGMPHRILKKSRLRGRCNKPSVSILIQGSIRFASHDSLKERRLRVDPPGYEGPADAFHVASSNVMARFTEQGISAPWPFIFTLPRSGPRGGVDAKKWGALAEWRSARGGFFASTPRFALYRQGSLHHSLWSISVRHPFPE